MTSAHNITIYVDPDDGAVDVECSCGWVFDADEDPEDAIHEAHRHKERAERHPSVTGT